MFKNQPRNIAIFNFTNRIFHFTFEMDVYAPVNVPIFYSNGFDSIYKKSS